MWNRLSRMKIWIQINWYWVIKEEKCIKTIVDKKSTFVDIIIKNQILNVYITRIHNMNI